jgi:hypothetical protein
MSRKKIQTGWKWGRSLNPKPSALRTRDTERQIDIKKKHIRQQISIDCTYQYEAILVGQSYFRPL